MPKAIYIALTALQSHWGDPKNTLMLGEWCQTLYENERCRENKKYATYPSDVISRRWFAPDELDQAARYCLETAHAVAPVLAEFLIRELKIENLDAAALKRIFGAWLLPFICIAYDRYLAVQDAMAFNPDACFITAPPDAAVIPAETPHGGVWPFAHGADVDTNNLILFSRIISFLGLRQKVVPLDIPPCPIVVQWSGRAQTFTGILRSYAKYLGKKYVYPRKIYLFSNMHMEISPQYPSWVVDDLTPPSQCVAINHDLRKKSLAYGDNDFTCLLARLIPEYIPWCLCEGLPGLVVWAKRHPARFVKIFVTALGNYSNTPLMVLANVAKRPLTVMDHSGGSVRHLHNSQVHEIDRLSIADDSVAQHLHCTLPSPQLSRVLPKSSESVPPVLVCNDVYRYPIRFMSGGMPSHAKNYHQARIDFLRAIPVAMAPIVRLYYKEFGWSVKSTLQKIFPLLQFQNPDEVPMDHVYATSSLLICDHQVSTFHFALARNIPMISFTAPGIYDYTEQGRQVINILEKAKIHNSTPESAAKHYCAIYGDIDAWWNSNEVQNARKAYTDSYVKMSEDWQRDWNNLISDALTDQ